MLTLLDIEKRTFNRLFVFFTWIGVLILCSFSFHSFNNGNRYLAYFLGINAALLMLNLLFYKLLRNSKYIGTMLSIIILVLCVGLVINGGYRNTGSLWVYPLFIALIFINKLKHNIIFSVVFVMFVIYFLYFYPQAISLNDYPDFILFRYLFTFVVLLVIAIVANYIKDITFTKYKRLNSVIEEKNQILAEYKHHVDLEHQVASKIFSNTFLKNMPQYEWLKYYMSAASSFSGDVLASAKNDKGQYYLLVGDVTGHGLASATVTLSIYPLFSNLVKGDSSLIDIIKGVNESLRGVLPRNMMMAANLLEIDILSKKLTVWAGGLPSMLIFRHDGKLEEVQSDHLPLSVLPSNEIDTQVQSFQMQSGDSILGFTDGIIESFNELNEPYGVDRLIASYRANVSLEEIAQQVKEFSFKKAQDDDITLIEIVF